ncbi:MULTISPECIES: ATP-dependent DNA ligase [Microbacterium]|uniref:DUF7882 family protein n=1 Tax=Microbacterium TaxID=33882 RepID=UPI000E71B05F|nr:MULTISPECIES: ATP-dependent DNA ligase [Microbacterium]MDF2579023.1 ATP-dependent ligase [Microbacterium sp.]RKE64052.1 hypothetical protein DEU36_1273 [Microbacterium sp. AG238]WJM16330.1 ATP-dependent DNA ligase [Microbacterium arborescens]
MGTLVYGSQGRTFDVEDRLLAHLRVVFMNKLRRNEPFMFHRSTDSGLFSVWVHPAVPMVFLFSGSRPPTINRHWVEALMLEAGGANGLRVIPEPATADA